MDKKGMRTKTIWTLLVALVLMTGCGKHIPNDVIQPDKMEQVLYDYHLAMSMSTTNHHMENYQKHALMNSIYEKHHITSAVFDSSMVWYTREAQELVAIYERLEKRFKREHNHMESILSSREEENTMTTSYGDTVDIWRKKDLFWLTNNQLFKRVTFDFSPDTNFHAKDAFLWDMDLHFFSEGKSIIGFNVVYENDSVVGETRIVEQSGKQNIYLYTDSAYVIKSLNGFVSIMDDSLSSPKILVKDITLTRYHRKE